MRRRHRTKVALAGVLLLGLSGATLILFSSGADADDRPASWTAYAEASGFRFSAVNPATLPTSDEIAGLSVPFARAETDSTPVGRAIGSWLWPGEGVADAKSLAMFGLDSSAAEGEIARRERERPGHGCDAERKLQTPEVRDANGNVVVPATDIVSPITGQPIYDPTDNPCGEASARKALQTVVTERVPDYPFWAHSLWPPNKEADSTDRKTVCEAPSAFPPTYELPDSVCGGAEGDAKGGLIEAISSGAGNWGTAQVSSFDLPGIARAGEITSLSRVEWLGTVLLSSSTVTVEDLTLFGAQSTELLHIEKLTSTAAVASDDRAPVSTLELSGVTVTVGGSTYRARVERNRLVIADQSLPDDVQSQLTSALNLLTQRISFGTCPAGCPAGDETEAGAEAGVVPANDDEATRTSRVAGLSMALSTSNSAQGSVTIKLSFGLAEAHAVARTTEGYRPPGGAGSSPSPPSYGGGGVVTYPGEGRTVSSPGSAPQRYVAAPVRKALPSEPVPLAVAVVAILGIVAGGGALVAAGIWEITP